VALAFAISRNMTMTSPEHRAHHVADLFAGSLSAGDREKLQIAVADAIQKAVVEDREAIRERMQCVSGDPCGFELCAHHKALVGAVMAAQEGAPPPARSAFSRPLNS
jgi:hypothetical protein